MFDPDEPEPMSPAHARDEVLCQLLREAIAAWKDGIPMIVSFTDQTGPMVPVSRLTLTRDWYERAQDAVGD